MKRTIKKIKSVALSVWRNQQRGDAPNSGLPSIKISGLKGRHMSAQGTAMWRSATSAALGLTTEISHQSPVRALQVMAVERSCSLVTPLQGLVNPFRINPRAALAPADRDLALSLGWHVTAFQA